MTSSSWPASRSPSLTPRRSKARPRLPVRPTGSTPGCSPELSRRDLVPEIWLPTPGVRAERERARFRLHLVRHRTALKNRIHATLLAFGKPCPVSDLLWRRRPAAAGPPGAARAVDRQPHRGPGPHRRPGRPDRRLRTAAAAAGRRSPLCAVVDDRTRDRLGAGLHHRCRGGRHHTVPLAQEAVRLYRAVPQGVPVQRAATSAVRWPTTAHPSCAGR
jgi:hypothetical protein